MAITHIKGRPMAEIENLRIVRLTPNNPRRAGTHGAGSWESYTDDMRVKDYIALGGDRGGRRRRHLTWDVEHGFVELHDD
jgi:hypothetical protein